MERYRPDLICRHLRDIDFAKLRGHGITAYCFDLDNTLALRHEASPSPKMLEIVWEAKRRGYIDQLCVVSNIIMGRQRELRVRNAAALLGTDHYVAARFWNRKPSPRPFEMAMQLMHSAPSCTAIIGDQLFTDVLGGNRLGMYTVLVQPLGPDHWTTWLTQRRQRERVLLDRLGLADYTSH